MPNSSKTLDNIIFCGYNRQENICQGGEFKLSTVRVGENESIESAMKRFKRKCQKDGIIGDLRKKEQYEKPSVRKKKKSEAARKRAMKKSRY